MIDGLFPSCGNLKLEETKLALSRYAAITPLFSFCPKIQHGIKVFCQSSADWYVIKYNEMSALKRLWYDDKNDVIQLNQKIQAVKARTLEYSYEPQVFLEEYQEYKRFHPKTNLLEALACLANDFTLAEWTKFLASTVQTQRIYESIAALYYECSLVNRQIGGFDILSNLKLGFKIKNPFIQKLAIRISLIYKENSVFSFSESRYRLDQLNAYVLADGKEPITLLEQLIEEKNEPILRAVLKELEIPFVDGLIQMCLDKRQARNVEFLMRFPHELKDEKLRALVGQFPSPPRKNTTVYTVDESEPDGFYFIERRIS